MHAVSGLKEYVEYTDIGYARASQNVARKIDGHKLPMLITGISEIGLMGEEVATELNIRWECAEWKKIKADGICPDLRKQTQTVPVNKHSTVIPVPVFFAKSGSKQIILGYPWETFT